MNDVLPTTTPNDKSTLKLHFFYVTLILCAAIILLATQNWTTLPGFTDYLNVAATVTSLVLGVLAIIYSFVSSNSTNNFLGSVEASAREMRTIGTEMRSIVTSGQELQSRAEQRNDELHKIVGNLREAVDTVSNKTTEIAGAVETLPSQFSELREEVRKRSQTEAPMQHRVLLKDLWKSEHHVAFLEGVSLLGLAALKGMLDAKLADKFCDLKTLFTTEHVKSFDYAYGFLIATSSAGVFKFECPGSLTLGHGKARLKAPSPEVVTAVTTEWTRRSQFEDAIKRVSVEKYAVRIAAALVDADESAV